MSMAITDKTFKWYAPHVQKSNYELNDDGTLTITGIASTTSKDLQGDIVLPEAIKSMKQQLSTSNKNLHGDHDPYLFRGLMGAIKEVVDSDDDTLKIKAIIRSKFASEIKEMLDIGINLGLSIGGKIKDYTPMKDGGWQIKDINLLEVSLTAMPANWDTFGTITVSKTNTVKAKCLTGACQVIRKTIMEDTKMAGEEGDNGNQNNTGLTTEEATELFNELMASQKDEIKSEVLEAVKSDLERLVTDKVEELTNNEPTPKPQEEDGEGEKALDELKGLFKEFADSQNEKLEKTVEEMMSKYVKDPNNRNPTPTPNPHQQKNNQNNSGETGDDGVKKAYTTKEIFEKMQAQKKANSLFNKLGVKED